MDKRIAELLDKQELAELTMRYCRGVDRGDEALILSCYHPDGRDDHGRYINTPAGFAERIVPAMRESRAWHHGLTGQLFELHGDTAYGETYFVFHSTKKDESLGMVSYGRYVDHFERRNGEWRILRRAVILDWMGELSGTAYPLDQFVRSRPDTSDHVYDVERATTRPDPNLKYGASN